MKNQKEIWRDVKNYEGQYQVSNLGRVKSLGRYLKPRPFKGQILKTPKNKYGYCQVSLCKNGKKSTKKVHQLVAIAFLYHVPDGLNIVVDHIDNVKHYNNVNNLQLISQRENSSKDTNGISNFTGVSWKKSKSKWVAQIRLNGKNKCLGLFSLELEASEAYQEVLKQIS